MAVALNDMVFDTNMNPVWCNTPESCRERLRQLRKTQPIVECYLIRVWRDGAYILMNVQEYLGEGETTDE